MPILAAEPDAWPPDLWSDEGAGLQSIATPNPERRWLCLHTRPRQEKVVSRHLHNKEIVHYLPLAVHEDRTPKGRKTRSLLPLFTSYLFCCVDERQRVEAMKGNNLVNMLEVPDQPKLVHDLRQLHQMLKSNLSVLPTVSHPVGATVRILSGPLMGMVGVIERRANRDRFIAIVHFLGRGASVELQDWQVERVV